MGDINSITTTFLFGQTQSAKRTKIPMGLTIGILALLSSRASARESCDDKCVAELQASIKQLREALATVQGALAARRTPVGTVIAYAGKSLPPGFVVADGSIVDGKRSELTDLCGVIGDTFRRATDPVGTCRLPDLQGRMAMGDGQNGIVGTTAKHLGEQLGEERHVLTEDEMPSHRHGYDRHAFKVIPIYDGVPLNFARANHNVADNATASDQTVASGGGKAHNVLPPSLVVRYLIQYAR
jgi:microcystin-dependent protein